MRRREEMKLAVRRVRGCMAGEAVTACALAAALMLGGCGWSPKKSSTTTTGTGRTTTTIASTAKRSEPPPKASIEVSIPVVIGDHAIPARYTCDGADVSLPVRWTLIPKGTAELVMFVIKLKSPSKGTFFDWAVAGLNPTSHGVSAGALPANAVVGRNSFGQDGYSICPPRGSGEEIFILRVVALPHPLAAKPGFDAEAFYNEAERSTKVVGIAGGVYTRR
jgi:phosphatidylethanolamine-binding protein (PEBP) family uncharacterized protein